MITVDFKYGSLGGYGSSHVNIHNSVMVPVISSDSSSEPEGEIINLHITCKNAIVLSSDPIPYLNPL